MKRSAVVLVALLLTACGPGQTQQHNWNGGGGRVVEVPEPSSLWLCLIGGLVLAAGLALRSKP